MVNRGKGGETRHENLDKGELALKHAAGLGATPNVVPETEPELDGPSRPVEVGWHPVGGAAGRWFARTALGQTITRNINEYPDPSQHWAVILGEFAHQLWMDDNFDVIYTNERISKEEWHTFEVGQTRFNDDATRRAGEHVIQTIRETQPRYNLITNNCQTYALKLLDAIEAGQHMEFATTLAVYERLVGPGKVKDLFAKTQVGGTPSASESSVSMARQVMERHTTTVTASPLSAKEQSDRDPEEADHEQLKDDGKHIQHILSRFTKH